MKIEYSIRNHLFKLRDADVYLGSFHISDLDAIQYQRKFIQSKGIDFVELIETQHIISTTTEILNNEEKA